MASRTRPALEKASSGPTREKTFHDLFHYLIRPTYWDREGKERLLLFLVVETYLNVATGNACAGQSNENPVAFATRNPTSFTDGNCGLLLEAGSKKTQRETFYGIHPGICWNRGLLFAYSL